MQRVVAPQERLVLRADIPGRCAFCPAVIPWRAVRLCGWPVQRFVDVATKELFVGDRFRNWVNGRQGVIRTIERYGDCIRVDVIEWPKVQPTRRTKISYPRQYIWHLTGTVAALRMASCDKVTCEIHQVERSETIVYCADHWSAWEQI